MIVFDYLQIILLFVLAGVASYSDIKRGIIPNKLIAVFAIISLGIDVAYYGFVAKDVALLFIANVFVISILGVILYYTRSLAGGDCKLIPVLAMLYPAGMYLTYRNSGVTLFLTICFAIFYGYVYLLITSIWRLILGDNKVDKNYVKTYLKGYFKSYMTAFIYVTFVNLLFGVVDRYLVEVDSWVVWIVCIVAAWSCGRINLMKRKAIIIAIVVVDIALSIALKVLPLSLNPRSYLLTAVLVLCQMTIRTNVYETIPTSRIKKGMILSTFSSMAMQSSRVQGLPKVSTEDLSCRLTEEEAESIKRWRKTTRGLEEISIVKKIPFAVFIAMGFFTYVLIWRVVV